MPFENCLNKNILYTWNGLDLLTIFYMVMYYKKKKIKENYKQII